MIENREKEKENKQTGKEGNKRKEKRNVGVGKVDVPKSLRVTLNIVMTYVNQITEGKNDNERKNVEQTFLELTHFTKQETQ